MDDGRDWPVPYEELREASMQAKFERLRETFDALVAALPLPARMFLRLIGPYGIRFSALFPRGSADGRLSGMDVVRYEEAP